jgi:SprT protein
MSAPEPDLALRREAIARGRRLLALAERHFRCPIPTPEVRFDLRGQAAGQARLAAGQAGQIRYNDRLLRDNPAEFLAQTVAHEVAHLVAYRVFGPRIRPHGREWRAVMALFGAPPQRCHRFAVARDATRRLPRPPSHCACRTHALTSIRHNRVQRGQRYYCRACGQALRPGAHPDEPAGERGD